MSKEASYLIFLIALVGFALVIVIMY